MNIEIATLLAIPAVLGAILSVSAGRDWLRRRRVQREIELAYNQRWELGDVQNPYSNKTGRPSGWTAADEAKWQRMGNAGMLGNDWRER